MDNEMREKIINNLRQEREKLDELAKTDPKKAQEIARKSLQKIGVLDENNNYTESGLMLLEAFKRPNKYNEQEKTQ